MNLKNPNAANNLIQEMFQLGFEDFNTLVYGMSSEKKKKLLLTESAW